jgi:hypothetical protein
MNLFDLVVLLVIFLIVGQFWRIRAISEKVGQHLEQYCRLNQLQLISIARSKTRLGSYQGRLDWKSEFTFEFSGTGEDSYQGNVKMVGLHVLETLTPAYRIN